jgi:hypothetical protein
MKRDCKKVVHITDELARQTAKLLDSFAVRCPSEGVVYWFGIETANLAVVTTLVVPDADTSSGRVRTSVVANAEATSLLVDTPLVYVGQAHSHPGAAVSHSDVDNEETFAQFDGVLSIVVPWFGRYGLHLEECGIHRRMSGHFHRIRDISEHVRIIPGFADLRSAK